MLKLHRHIDSTARAKARTLRFGSAELRRKACVEHALRVGIARLHTINWRMSRAIVDRLRKRNQGFSTQ
jgi:hypothetical protein